MANREQSPCMNIMELRSTNANDCRPFEVAPRLPDPALPRADWADAFEMMTHRRFADMRELAQATVGSMPSWAQTLLKLRNTIVRPFGLKPDGAIDVPSSSRRIGIFPIIDENADSIILGLDDVHLDFRIVVERTLRKAGDRLRVTTLVQRHNLLGRMYIAVITPFHKAIVTAVMRQAG